jgi:hypothetical protein
VISNLRPAAKSGADAREPFLDDSPECRYVASR